MRTIQGRISITMIIPLLLIVAGQIRSQTYISEYRISPAVEKESVDTQKIKSADDEVLYLGGSIVIGSKSGGFFGPTFEFRPWHSISIEGTIEFFELIQMPSQARLKIYPPFISGFFIGVGTYHIGSEYGGHNLSDDTPIQKNTSAHEYFVGWRWRGLAFEFGRRLSDVGWRETTYSDGRPPFMEFLREYYIILSVRFGLI